MAGAFIASAADGEAGRRRRMWYAKPMKAVQATFDEGLLDKLDRYGATRTITESASFASIVPSTPATRLTAGPSAAWRGASGRGKGQWRWRRTRPPNRRKKIRKA